MLRSAPDSFVPYLCLGTPGLPERPAEVRRILEGIRKRSPDEPHARIYLALMRVYALQDVEEREFTEPLAILEQRRLLTDIFLGRLALIERVCIQGRGGHPGAAPGASAGEELRGARGSESREERPHDRARRADRRVRGVRLRWGDRAIELAETSRGDVAAVIALVVGRVRRRKPAPTSA
ncbi:MAG TPA: hypothetical protein VGF41_09590 [Myxococcaceae bacterium]